MVTSMFHVHRTLDLCWSFGVAGSQLVGSPKEQAHVNRPLDREVQLVQQAGVAVEVGLLSRVRANAAEATDGAVKKK